MVEVEQYQSGRSAITGTTAREIAASAEAGIRNGSLRTGERLPTVRALASMLGTSPATVNAAYRTLGQRGLVIAEGRRGTHVAPRPALRVPPARRGSGSAPAGRDLSHGLPDPGLLPPIPPVLARLDLEAKLRMTELDPVDPDLHAAAADWFGTDGVATEAITVLGGALDAIERVLHAHLRPGDRVIVEDPAYPPIRDILLALGLVAVGVPVDERGLIVAEFEAALAKEVAAVLVVPRAQNPRGSALDEERAADLRAVLARRPGALVVEDDHAGLVAGAPYRTLVDSGRARWAVIRSMSKVLHPDLRLALVAGDETTIGRVEGRQALGPRWVSHILQAVAADLLRDPGFESTAARARDAYTARRNQLIEALAAHGIHGYGRSGMNVWVPVREEAPAVQSLLDAGWVVLAGERFRLATPPGVRITVSTLEPGEAEEVAGVVAEVEHRGRSRQAY